jgi:hypothetical protein
MKFVEPRVLCVGFGFRSFFAFVGVFNESYKK